MQGDSGLDFRRGVFLGDEEEQCNVEGVTDNGVADLDAQDNGR